MARRTRTALTLEEEFVARAKLANPFKDRMRLGMPVVVSGPDGQAQTIDPHADKAQEPKPAPQPAARAIAPKLK